MNNLPIYTNVHILMSLAAIASGLVVLLGMVAGKGLDRWAAVFLATAAGTSLTGFGFPVHGFVTGIGLGIVSLPVVVVATYARYGRQLAGVWRPVHVVAATAALYLIVLVAIFQAFQKVPALKAMAPTNTERPLAVAQIVGLGVFLILGALAWFRFRAPESRAA